ncbi:lipoprotein-anchoring transpeptidase ErfK/SrfK [Bradyrhizobium sp. USDA 4461]
MTHPSLSSRRLASRVPRTHARTLAFAGALFVTPFVVTTTANAQVSSSALGYASTQPGAFPSDEAMTNPSTEATEDGALPERLRRTIVALNTSEAPGTVIIDTGNTALYYVLGGGRAIRYGVGVGREGFTWAGTQTISRKAEWPDWHPPAEMIKRQPYLPRFMAGGPGNPLGARAMYLGSSEYRIHGTNDPTTIGKFVSSGCIRLTNEDVSDLFSRVDVGAKVVVLPKNAPHLAARELGPATTQISVRAAPGQPRPAVMTLPSGRQAMNIPATSSLY